jgi:hypothetical protein
MRVLSLLMVLLLIPVSAQRVEEISNLNLSVFVNDKAHLRYEFTIKNLIDKPLVPGIGEIRLQKVEPAKLLVIPIPFTEERKAVKVENLKAYSGNMNFKTGYEEKEGYSVVYYEIWYPIEPYGERNVVLEFDADLVDRGILFKSITIPVGGDMDIKNLRVSISSNWSSCYLEPKELNAVPANHIAFVTAEFSVLPLPLLPVRGYLLFWGILIGIMLLLLIWLRK